MLESYPEPKKHNDAKAVETFEWLKDFVLGIRRIRADYNIEPKKVLSMSILGSSEEQLGWLEQNEDIIMAVARVGRISQAKEPLIEAATVLVGELTLYIPFEGLIEKKAERARLQKELLKAEQEATQTSKKLENQSFTDRAPEKVVKEMRARLEIAANMIAKLQIQMKKF